MDEDRAEARVIKSILVCMALVLNVLPWTAPGAGAEEALTILYTGGMDGELEPCGCSPKTDFGGLARLSGYISAHSEALSPYILVDAGNFTDKDTPQGRLKAEAFLKSFSIMKYDAVAFSDREKAFPGDFLPPLLEKYKVPVLPGDARGPQSILIPLGNTGIHVSISPEHPLEGMVNILLTGVPPSQAEGVEGWDIVISSSGEELEEPLRKDGAVIVSGFPRGKKLGILRVKRYREGNREITNTWQELGNDSKEDPRVREVLDEYDAKVAQLMKEAERPPAGTTYLGVDECAKCHQVFVESWEKTRHAGAFADLEAAGKANDPECVMCHTVGYGEPGGFFSIDTTPELANVQCEECHGLNREHINDFSSPMMPVTEEVCLKCHTKENSPDFNFSVYLKKISH